MNRKKAVGLIVVLGIIVNLLILFKLPAVIPDTVAVKVEVEATKSGDYQMFYSDGIFDINNCQTITYDEAGEKQVLEFWIPTDYTAWRIDFGSESADVKIYSIDVSYHGDTDIKKQLLSEKNELKGVTSMKEEDGYIAIRTTDDDPQCIFGFDKNYINDIVTKQAEDWCSVLNIILCAAIDIILLGICVVGNRIVELFRELYANKKLILNLAKNDFKTKFVGSYLGIIWAFIQPTVTIVVYWFVFQVGLRSGDVGDFPFILWLIAGLVPWFFFSDALSAGTTALMEYQYLVKQMVFKISIIPVVKVLSAMFVHVFFMALTVVIFACYGYTPDWHTLQIIYYTFCVFVLGLSLVYFTCSIVVFFRDTTQIVNIFLQIGIWMTPIMWNISMLPPRFLWIFKSMPLYYIVMGYRDSLIDKVWFWEKPYETAWFWGVTIVLFGFGTIVFKKLKVHFADVL